jgi:hypothetical protein
MSIIGKYIYENNFLYIITEDDIFGTKLIKNETELSSEYGYNLTIRDIVKKVIQSDFKPIKGSIIKEEYNIRITKNYINPKIDENKIKNWHFKAASSIGINKLDAIKAYRNIIDIGLKEAKDAIDFATSGAQFMTYFTTNEYNKIQNDPYLKTIYVAN